MKYQIKQKFFSLKNEFFIKNEKGEDVYKVAGQFLSIGQKLRIYDMNDNELCYIEQLLLTLLPKYKIRMNGEEIATINKKFNFFTPKFSVDMKDSSPTVDGQIFSYEFSIKDGDKLLATISKQFFALTDTYGVETKPEADDVLMLAIAIVIDMVLHNNNKNS